MSVLFERAAKFCADYQVELCNALAELDGGAAFSADAWQRPGGGGGVARVLEAGTHIEKAGVSFSSVDGEVPEGAQVPMPGQGRTFRACGISAVVHPRSPMVPTGSLTLRCFERGGATWLAGGTDLSPFYFFRDDVVAFHQALADACGADYARYKARCDEHYYLPHRGETRGVGGIVFDDLEGSDAALDLVQAVARAFMHAYIGIARRRSTEPYGEPERLWQLRRRGRYAEFALLHDRATRFGIETNGRIESILLALPPLARWDYDPQAQPGSPEVEMLTHLRPTSWLHR